MNILREFFGFGGYTRAAEGYMSWQHLLFVSALVFLMLVISVFLGKKYRDRDARQKNRPIIAAAILIDSFELLKIILLSVRQEDPMHFVYDLPLFLCSIQLISIPLAAFSKGWIKEAALDFVTIFGMLGEILGTYCAGNNYGSYPVISFDNVVSGITHCISGFTSLYIILSGTVSMKKRNMPIT
ncbi:MAG: YwaF family protein, partial [Clostridia bacterium]|nr:YwaF family protein [Clostridia bacterium]